MADLPRGRLGAADARRRAGRVAHQIAHLAWTDHVALLAATDPDGVLRAGSPRRRPDPDLRRRAAPRSSSPRRPSCSPAGGPAGPRSPTRCAAVPAGRSALVRHRDVAGLDGHRPDHGDLGARRGRRRRARRRPRPTARLRHVAHLGLRTLGLRLRRPRPAGADGAGPGRADRARTATLWTFGPGGRRRPGHRARARTSACWSPSAGTAPTWPWSPTGPVADEWLDVAQAFAGPPGAGRAAGRRGPAMTRHRSADRQRLRLLRRPVHRLAGDARRRRAGRADRRLPGRADHADPRPGPAGATPAWATRRRSCASWRRCLGTALDRGVRIVTNAGGLNPAGLADALRALADRLGLDRPGRVRRGRRRRPCPDALTANAYLGAFGIAECLRRRRGRGGHRPGHRRLAGGRPGDRPVRLGPRRPRRAGRRDRGRAHPRVRRAGHRRQLHASSPSCPTAAADPGFPIAEVHADGSAVITKHPGTGGAVTVETVTAQLLYEIGAPAYLGPGRGRPGSTRSRCADDGPDRVRVTGVRGSAAAGHRQGGRQHARRLPQLDDVRPVWTGHRGEGGPGPGAARGRRSARTGWTWRLARTDHPDAADTEDGERAAARTHPGPGPGAGRAGLLAGRGGAGPGLVPGLHADHAARRRARPYGVFTADVRAAGRGRAHVAVLPDGDAGADRRRPTVAPRPAPPPTRRRVHRGRRRRGRRPDPAGAARRRWSAPAPATRAATPTSASGPAPTPAYAWLRGFLTVERLRRAAARDARRWPSSGTSCRTCARSTSSIRGPARRRGGRVHPVRPAGQGARRVAALPASSTSRRSCCG